MTKDTVLALNSWPQCLVRPAPLFIPARLCHVGGSLFLSRVCGSARRVVVDQLLVCSYVALPVTWRYAFCSPPSCAPMVRHPWYAPWPDEEYFCCQFRVLHLLLRRPSRKMHAPRVVCALRIDSMTIKPLNCHSSIKRPTTRPRIIPFVRLKSWES